VKEPSCDDKEVVERVNFIQQRIVDDLAAEKNSGLVHTRFPPEPNGYLHIGHAKSICLNFGLAKKFSGICNLRFDDTNPTKEDVEYVDSIKEDVKWLGFDWGENEFFASDYFSSLYDYAIQLIQAGKAYVCDLNPNETREYRGSLQEPGRNSPFRERSVDENLDLFSRMRAGEFADGSRVLRAKIDMASGNMNMRDPVIYRIAHVEHHRTGDKWCIYPMYDFAHGQSDFIEGITHSICTLEFEVHRPLYNWFLEQIIEDMEPKPVVVPRQIEFARLNLNYTVMSKRKLLELVQNNYVDGWDDPRMPTISGLRRRGYTPGSIRDFADRIGVAKRDGIIDVAVLEHCVRDDLNKTAPRVYAVLDPVKLVITNYPEGKVEMMEAVNNPEDESMGTREIPFSREIYIEKDDFMIDPPRKFFRLAPGKEVRLKNAYIIKCEDYKQDENGEVTEIYCTYDPDTKSGMEGSKRKVKGTLHWVSVEQSIPAEVRLYDRLFNDEDPNGHEGVDFKEFLNPDSLKVVTTARVETNLKDVKPLDNFQFQRLGYFCVDKISTEDKLVFNRTVPLKDAWAKMSKKGK